MNNNFRTFPVKSSPQRYERWMKLCKNELQDIGISLRESLDDPLNVAHKNVRMSWEGQLFIIEELLGEKIPGS